MLVAYIFFQISNWGQIQVWFKCPSCLLAKWHILSSASSASFLLSSASQAHRIFDFSSWGTSNCQLSTYILKICGVPHFTHPCFLLLPALPPKILQWGHYQPKRLRGNPSKWPATCTSTFSSGWKNLYNDPWSPSLIKSPLPSPLKTTIYPLQKIWMLMLPNDLETYPSTKMLLTVPSCRVDRLPSGLGQLAGRWRIQFVLLGDLPFGLASGEGFLTRSTHSVSPPRMIFSPCKKKNPKCY